MRSYYLGELTWVDVEEFLKVHRTVIVPVGSCEQHGPHLPLDTDAFDAFWLSRKAAEKAECALVAPPIYYGVSLHHLDFPGTITLNPQTLGQVVYEIGVCLTKHGFMRILFENGHGGNTPALEAAAQKIKAETGAFVAVDTVSLIPDFIEQHIETPYDAHAGEFETSTTLANRENAVVQERITKPSLILPKLKYVKLGLREAGPKVSWAFRTRDISNTGVIGDPTKASKEKGEKAWQLAIERLAELLKELDSM